MALHLAHGSDLDQAFQELLGPPPTNIARPAPVDWPRVREEWLRAYQSEGDAVARLRPVGALALSLGGIDDGERRKLVATQLPVTTWPSKKLWVVALNAKTGERRALDRESGADLVDAMVATTSFFGSPAALIDGQPYIDGGYYSSNNADLASGFDEVLILSLRPPEGALHIVSLEAMVEGLRAKGSRVEVIQPDERCEQAIASVGNTNSPAVRGPAARAGHELGLRLAAEGRLDSWR